MFKKLQEKTRMVKKTKKSPCLVLFVTIGKFKMLRNKKMKRKLGCQINFDIQNPNEIEAIPMIILIKV
jgi:hypothetical protein